MVMLLEMALLFSILLLIRFLLPSQCVGTIQMNLESLKDTTAMFTGCGRERKLSSLRSRGSKLC